ncbi:hypothetical protein [Yoonia sp. R2-816]|uniref:hypothetical protein n=1 Tax=Yoonia sp. R2-816 TaxID=3342638 RepID=UPI0037294B27
MTLSFAGVKDGHLRVVFEVSEDGQVSERFASKQVTWPWQTAAKSFRKADIGSKKAEGLRKAWHEHLRSIDAIGLRGAFLDSIVELQLPPHHAFPRMARTSFGDAKSPPWVGAFGSDLQNEAARFRTELVSQLSRLNSVCRVIEPRAENLNAFGAEIGELLILSCVGVETCLSSVLRANSHPKTRFTTNDFYELCEPLRLREYKLAFADYPWLEPFSPFLEWNSASPTKSLRWYDRYNGEKHDRTNCVRRGKLIDSFNAISAFAVLQVAQFGVQPLRDGAGPLNKHFSLVAHPVWPPEQQYIELHMQAGRIPWCLTPFFNAKHT